MPPIKDITNELRGRKSFDVVPAKENAQIVIEVLSRGTTSTSGGGAVAAPIGTSTFLIPIGTIGIATTLRVGPYEKPIILQNCQSWRYCARLVAKDIEAWVAANPSVALTSTTPTQASENETTVPCATVAAQIEKAPGENLAAKIRASHPGSYINTEDARLEQMYLTSYPCLKR